MMLAVAGHCPEHGMFYKSPDDEDRLKWQAAEKQRPGFTDQRHCFDVHPGQKSVQLPRRGVNNYLDIYSSRQLLSAIGYQPFTYG
ncbi:MAG: hypothetical protein R3C44_05560 [Chloroflexota bacterium]